MFPLLNIISYLEILETNNNRVLKTSSNALSKPFLENFNEQPASISDVLQLHTEKSIRNVRPILMEEQRQHVKTMNVLLVFNPQSIIILQLLK
ncbi:hypothetical protein T09_14450 [Trichinella sp. T9]|nr:hypothetical protein T09_14450 [Trichinella sp. T9]